MARRQREEGGHIRAAATRRFAIAPDGGRRGGTGTPQRLVRYLPILSFAGALVTVGQVLWWSSQGAWPFHDSASIWFAGIHLREGSPVYSGVVGGFLSFLYSPPVAVLAGAASLLPLQVFTALLFLAQVAAFRYVAGSWLTAGLLCWVPFVPRALITGNVDFLMAATIYASVRGVRGSGVAAAVFTFIKLSPVLAVRRWVEFAATASILIALTLPWLDLWPAWVAALRSSLATPTDTILLLPRIPVVIGLFALRRPWSIAAAAALATPAFYFHSWVLLLAAVRLHFDDKAARNGRTAATFD